MSKLQRAAQITKQLDWAAVYKDYLNSDSYSLHDYYHRYFKDFCASCGITDLMISLSSFYSHTAQFRTQPSQQPNNVEQTTVASEATVAGDERCLNAGEHSSSMQEQVAVFDLEKLMAAAPVASSVSSISIGREPATRNLSIEWSGIKFAYPCLDPGRSLASLLFYLRELEEAHHAY